MALSNDSRCSATSSDFGLLICEGRLAEAGAGGGALGVAEAIGVGTDEGTGVSEAATEGVVGFGEAVDLTVLAAERERRAFAGFLDGRGV